MSLRMLLNVLLMYENDNNGWVGRRRECLLSIVTIGKLHEPMKDEKSKCI